jgi:hypothetical protein
MFGTFSESFIPGLNPSGAADVTSGTYDQLLNPQDPTDTRTFKQRYYVYSSHAVGPNAPVIFYICGESECVPGSFLGRFTEDVATALNAHIVSLEHRYYGKSVPFDTLTADNLKYLSTDNALADLARFQHYAMTTLNLSGKWISIGGSYPGSLSAFYRLTHPELVVGSLASSAPVEAKNAFEEYDGHVTQVVGPVCAAALRKVIAASETALAAGPDAFKAFKVQFGGQDVVDDRDFLYMLADITADAVQYGYPERICTPLTTSADPVAAYATYVKAFFVARGETAVTFSPQGATALGAQDSDGMRQWYYQSCKEYGYWQDSNRDPAKSVRSPRIAADYDRDYCTRLFGITQLADENAMNSRFYEPLMHSQVTRIVFTNGSADPWSELSINSVRGNNVNPGTPTAMIQGLAHCSDLGAQKPSDPQSLKDARSLFLGLAADWVK